MISYTRQLQELGEALQTIETFNRTFAGSVSEGVKARYNHFVTGMLSNLSDEDKNIVFSEMNFDYLDKLNAFKGDRNDA